MANPYKYEKIELRITELFYENKERYGYRRINAILRREGTVYLFTNASVTPQNPVQMIVIPSEISSSTHTEKNNARSLYF